MRVGAPVGDESRVRFWRGGGSFVSSTPVKALARRSSFRWIVSWMEKRETHEAVFFFVDPHLQPQQVHGSAVCLVHIFNGGLEKNGESRDVDGVSVVREQSLRCVREAVPCFLPLLLVGSQLVIPARVSERGRRQGEAHVAVL